MFLQWYRGSESNRHSRRNRILNPARLPVPPPRRLTVERDYICLWGDTSMINLHLLIAKLNKKNAAQKSGVKSTIMEEDRVLIKTTRVC